MGTTPVTGNHWLEPLLPESLPEDLLAMASALPFKAGRLQGMLPPATANRLGALLRVTSSYYSNLIEGQYTEPVELAATAPQRSPKQLSELAITHMRAQEVLERAATFMGGPTWATHFSSDFVAGVHRRLFSGARPEELRLVDGTDMLPGQLRGDAQRNVMVGEHVAPDHAAVLSMLDRMQEVYGNIRDPRRQLLAALAFHHRLAWVHPFPDGNGRVVRMITHLQLLRLGLVSPLWSLSRGLARRQKEYYARLANADAPRRGDIDGRGQLTQEGLFEFLRFMLSVCADQLDYMIDAVSTEQLRDRLERLVVFERKFIDAGVKPEAARALHILITQGAVSRSDFKVYLGLGESRATAQLKALIGLGVVESPTPKSREIYPGLPVWFAQQVFPDLHRRFI